jgi:uncharacterized protein YkwD
MRIRTHVVVVFGVVFLILGGVATASAAVRMTSSEVSVLHAVNAVLAAHGLRAFRVGTRLQRAARAHTLGMMRTGTFGHGSFSARMARFGIRGSAAENIGWGSGSYARAGAIVEMWLQSPPHRANLLRARWRLIGIGAVAGSFDGEPDALVVTADFAG